MHHIPLWTEEYGGKIVIAVVLQRAQRCRYSGLRLLELELRRLL